MNRRSWMNYAFVLAMCIAAFEVKSAGQDTGKVGLDNKEKPSNATIAAAKDTKPPANASAATSIGKGRLTLSKANQGYVWSQEVDYNADGTMEQVDYFYDPAAKITYHYVEKDFTCAAGTSRGNGGVLIAVYNTGNKLGRPAGSGWYVADLDKGECNAQAAALWGCRFDANGNVTVCGIVAAQIQDDIEITQTSSGGTPRN
jgi:hypothetical protein